MKECERGRMHGRYYLGHRSPYDRIPRMSPLTRPLSRVFSHEAAPSKVWDTCVRCICAPSCSALAPLLGSRPFARLSPPCSHAPPCSGSALWLSAGWIRSLAHHCSLGIRSLAAPCSAGGSALALRWLLVDPLATRRSRSANEGRLTAGRIHSHSITHDPLTGRCSPLVLRLCSSALTALLSLLCSH